MKLNIVIIDDNPDIMRGPETILENMEPLQLGEEEITWKVDLIEAKRGYDVEALASEVSRFQPSVAVVDMRLKGDATDDLSGVNLSLRIRALCPDCCIILISTHFAETPQKELFEHLEVFRSLVSRGPDLDSKGFEMELKSKVMEAILTYASTVNYRRLTFARSVDAEDYQMWGLVLKPDNTDKNGMARLSVEKNLPIPNIRSNSVVVKLLEVGVCGTDRKSLGMAPPPDYSLIDFHEAFGKVVWVGEDVRSLEVGDYVVPMVRRCDSWDRPDNGAGIEPSSFGFRRCDDATHCAHYPHADRCPLEEFQKQKDGKRQGYKSRGTGKCHGFGSQYFVDTEEWLIRVELPSKDQEDLRNRMMKRYVLTEPLSIVWKAHREIIKHYSIREYDDRALIIGLGSIGLLAATVMHKLHPGLKYTAIDLATETNERVELLKQHFPEFTFVHADKEDEVPSDLNLKKGYNLIIESTDQPDKVFKYVPSLLAPGGILVLIGISNEDNSVVIAGTAITKLVKRGNTLIGSINSSRSDFENSIAFMERVIGNENSILDDVSDDVKGMVTRLPIDDLLPEKLAEVGRVKPWERNEIKIVLDCEEPETRQATLISGASFARLPQANPHKRRPPRTM